MSPVRLLWPLGLILHQLVDCQAKVEMRPPNHILQQIGGGAHYKLAFVFYSGVRRGKRTGVVPEDPVGLKASGPVATNIPVALLIIGRGHAASREMARRESRVAAADDIELTAQQVVFPPAGLVGV